MLEKGTVKVFDPLGPGHHSCEFLVEKVTTRWRPVVELSVLNWYMTLIPFKMVMVALVLESIRKGVMMFSITEGCIPYIFI